MKKILVAAAVAVVLAGGYYMFSKSLKDPSDGLVTKTVVRGDITSYVSATGKLNPKVSVIVGTEVSGTIRGIFVDNNSAVTKGQVLVKLDQDLIAAQVEQAGARLASAQARLRELESSRGVQISEVDTSIEETRADAQKAAADLERGKLLFSQGVIAREELDDKLRTEAVSMARYNQALAGKARYGVIDAQIDAARAAVREAEAGLSTAETNLSKTVITAPMDGVVINKNVEVGQTVAASFNTPTLLDIGDLSVMEVEVSVDEADVGRVAVGQETEFTVDAFPGRVFKGVVSEIYYAPIEVQNVVTYNGIVDVDNPDGALRPGMTANVNVITSRKKAVLMVPSAALRVNLDEVEGRDGKPEKTKPGLRRVWVVSGGKPEPVEVQTGVTDFTNTEIVSGLKEGDEVVVEKSGDGRAGGSSSGRPMRMFH